MEESLKSMIPRDLPRQFCLQHPGCLGQCFLTLSSIRITGNPTCSRSLNLFQASTSVRMETQPSGQTARPPVKAKGQVSPCTEHRGWGGAVQTCLLRCPVYYQWLRLLVWKNTQKSKILIASSSVQNKNYTAQERPLVYARPQVEHPSHGSPSEAQTIQALELLGAQGGDNASHSGTKASPASRPMSAAG